MTCHGESCRQGRATCTEGCNEPCTPLIQTNHDWAHASESAIALRLLMLVFCTMVCIATFAVSAWMLLRDSPITRALASLARNFKFL